MTTIENVIKFLNDYVIECAPDDGCQRCNEAREHVAALEKLSLPPAEGAEEILANLEAYYDFKFHWIEKDRIIRAMQEFATLHAQKIADKMVEWISVKDKLPKERENVLCYNGYRISSHNWCKHTDKDDDWFKKTFTHWCKLPKTP